VLPEVATQIATSPTVVAAWTVATMPSNLRICGTVTVTAPLEQVEIPVANAVAVPTTCSSLDISILTARGRAYFLKSLAPSQHTVHVDPTTNQYVLVAAFNDKASCTTVRPIGFQLKKGMMINDVRVQVTAAFAGAAAASNRYSVGRSGAALGFLNNLTLSAIGFRNPAPTPSTTGFAIASRYGSDLSYFHSSSTGGVDLYVRKSFIAPATSTTGNLVVKRQTAATLTHSFTNTGVSGAGKGYIYYMYTLLPTEA